MSPIPPEQIYELTRRTLRVRKDFVEELLKPKVSSTDLKSILGEERAKVDAEQWTAEEQAKVDAAQAESGRKLFEEKVAASLEAIETELKVEQAVYVSSGIVYARGDEKDSLKTIEVGDDKSTEMVSWPLAHNVRSAGWSLGVGGCLECHSENAKIFASTVATIGPGPDRGEPVTMASLQGVDPNRAIGVEPNVQRTKVIQVCDCGFGRTVVSDVICRNCRHRLLAGWPYCVRKVFDWNREMKLWIDRIFLSRSLRLSRS